MIGISRLYLGQVQSSDSLRYARCPKASPWDRRPVVVWNVTSACNLRCLHCYAATDAPPAAPEPTPSESRAFVDAFAAFGCPALLFSGGEPLLRPDLPDLVARAVRCGMRAVLSTNGLLLDAPLARRLKQAGLTYAGISVDGPPAIHDTRRGRTGAFDATLAGIRACRDAGIRVGLRFTICRDNAADIPWMFQFMRAESIPRICFYHLAYSGRGAALSGNDLSLAERRAVVDGIIDGAAAFQRDGVTAEVLTVDNACDGPYLYLRLLREGSPRAPEVLAHLRSNGGNGSGVGIGCVSWDGTVYADPFWRNRPLGNVRDRPFGAIWSDRAHPLLSQLKDRHRHLTGRCAVCRFLDACNGNLRARAEAATGDPWAPDPACYLTEAETDSATALVPHLMRCETERGAFTPREV